MDTLANLLINIKNCEMVGKTEVVSRPTSRLSTEVLKIMELHGYVGGYEIIDDGRGSVYKIKLVHKLNNCGSIKPRIPIRHSEIERWEKRYLPAQGFGIILLTSSKGIMTHQDAKKKGIGGKLLAFVY